ncbi:MAG: DUF2182 domain-containing protein [Gammaproteobacteria bacterium]
MAAALQRIGRDRLAMMAGLALVAASGWIVLVRMSAGMVEPAGAAALMPLNSNIGFGMVWLMWTAMVAAMMTPAAGPGLSAYLALARRRHSQQNIMPAATGFFAGYMVVWLGYAALGAAVQWMLAGTALLSPMGASASIWLSAGVLAAAGVYQLTPLKHICVTRCRNPLLQLMGAWHDGVSGALRLGLKQGSWCIGCCWMLMALMFVVGVMNLAWMAILAVFLLAEKLVPARWHLDAAIGLLLLAAAAFLGLHPLVEPGLGT